MFYERLQHLCKERGTTVSNMLKDLGLSTGSTGNWKKGQLPKGDILVRIAEYLDYSIDFLVSGEYKTDLKVDEFQLIELYRAAPERAKYKLLCDFEQSVNEEIEKFAKEKGTG
ncbi:MAG: helix-turn-helix domain-containing protein [Ruminococcus sp.]|nr:helix-turn-helix domain-containing protein [Ruminococcus sp.]